MKEKKIVHDFDNIEKKFQIFFFFFTIIQISNNLEF